jgi:hypothetical protein
VEKYVWENFMCLSKKGGKSFEWRNMGNSCAFQKRVAKVLSGEIWEKFMCLSKKGGKSFGWRNMYGKNSCAFQKRGDYMTNPRTHVSFLSASLLYSLLSR